MTDDRYERSRAQHERARRSLAGGVATAFRASQLPVPITFDHGHGACLTDIDGNEYVDYALAFGPMLLGHSPAPIVEAVTRQVATGIGYGASHRLEAELAEAICRTVPCAESCALSSTGSEAVHAAIRLARAATGRRRVIKFLGHYHGWFDPLFIGTPGLGDASPATGGQDPHAASATTVCAWNDLDALRAAMDDDVAAVIMEPLAVNGGCISPAPGYLEGVRALTAQAGAVLIFDEVITGYRLGLGGAQERFGVVPDLAVLGKALGGGFPISAVCGRAAIMEEAATQRVAHVGTFNANPVCAAAAVAAITTLEQGAAEIYPQLEKSGARLAEMFREGAAAVGVPLVVNQVGGIAHAFVSGTPVDAYPDTLSTDAAAYRRFAEALLAEGVHVIPRGLLYVSAAHGETELLWTREAVGLAAARLAPHSPSSDVLVT
ncbi:MAG: aspartate aminotransferase family protein [Chloroflexota bacterium]|nr:aspartate aminotransferase family protein [Chloroflexota bacterium]